MVRSEREEYVSSSSIRSNQSPAAYLKEIYEVARSEIKPEKDILRLEVRRPDLANLVLSDDSLKKETTTLEVVNIILTAGLEATELFSSEDDIYRKFETMHYPLQLPFHVHIVIVRESLKAIGGLDLNSIIVQGRENSYPFLEDKFTYTPYPAERAGFFPEEEVIMMATLEGADVYKDMFGFTDGEKGIEEMQLSDKYCQATGLSNAEFFELLGQDAAVVDESDESFLKGGMQFLCAEHYIYLEKVGENRYKTTASETMEHPEIADIPPLVHQVQNKCIRLQRRTCIPFPDLDRLLFIGYYTHSDDHATSPGNIEKFLHEGGATLVLGHFKDWNERYSVTQEEFLGIMGEINSLRKEGSGKVTLMRKLFGDDAAKVTMRTRMYHVEALKVGEIESEGLGEILRRGFKLTKNEWEIILALVSGSDETKNFDFMMLAAIYRITKLFGLFEWGILEGMGLCRVVEEGILRDLGTSRRYSLTFVVIDKLRWLSEWMKEANLSPSMLITALTPGDEGFLLATDDTLRLIDEVQQSLRSSAVTSLDFAPYTELQSGSEIVPIPESEWMAGLQEKAVFDEDGIVKTSADIVEAKLKEFLTDNGVEISEKHNIDVINELKGLLDVKNNVQNRAIATQISQKAESLPETAVIYLLDWFEVSYYDAKRLFLSWKLSLEDENAPGLKFLFNVYRHVLVVDKLKLDECELEIVTQRPSLLANEMTKCINLQQIFILSRFKGIQNDHVSATDWMAYFARMSSSDSKLLAKAKGFDSHDMYDILSHLLDWPSSEISEILRGSSIGTGKVGNVQQCDFVARQIALCQETKLSASELHALQNPNKEYKEWELAAKNCLSALQRYDDGKFYIYVQGSVNEMRRDALVGSYMYEVISGDGDLSELVTSRNDLYEYLLVDVEVSSQVPTTLMLEATYAVQLYVNRAILNIEPSVIENRTFLRSKWSIAQQYRVWEADMKLKQFPSTFLEPHLRRGKTDIFQKFENELSVGNLDEDIVQKAIQNYISGLQRLTELDVHGFFFTRNTETVSYFLTAKAHWERHGYYYRKLDINRKQLEMEDPFAVHFSDWKKTGLALSVDQVYGVVPGYAWGRLFLFWLELHELPDDYTESEKKYVLNPRYSRLNLDGTFTDPYIPSVSGVSLDVTALIDIDNGPSEYSPVIYQPYYDTDEELIKLVFNTDPNSNDSNCIWSLGSSTGSLIQPFKGALNPRDELQDYTSIQHSFRATNNEYSINPASHKYTYKYSVVEHPYPIATLEINSGTWEFTLSGKNKVLYRWSAAWIQLVFGTSKYALKEARMTLKANGTVITDQPIIGRQEQEGFWYPEDVTDEFDLTESEVEISYSVAIIFELRSTSSLWNIGDNTVKADSSKTWTNKSIAFRQDEYTSCLFYGKRSGIQDQRFIVIRDEARGTYVFSLHSTGMKELTALVSDGGDMRGLYKRDLQNPPEKGVDQFILQVENSTDPFFGPVKDPKPPMQLDYNGAVGIYSWELFYYIPTMLLAQFREKGQYEQGLSWMRMVYDPQAESGKEWITWALHEDQDTGALTITDPDELARKETAEYRLATIRQYLQTINEIGDAQYRNETAESLRMANMAYIEAMSIFRESPANLLNIPMLPRVRSPTLGTVNSFFLPPVNSAIQEFLDTLQSRLTNLRLWRSINGDPLSISLLAATIDPLVLQMAALSGITAPQAAHVSQMFVTVSFYEAMSKAKEVVKDFIVLGDRLYSGMKDQDDHIIEEMNTRFCHFVVEQFEEGGQKSIVEHLGFEKKVLEAEKAEAEEYSSWYKRFAGEYANPLEGIGIATLSYKNAHHFTSVASHIMAGGLGMIPNVFGFAFGGGKGDSIPDRAAAVSELSAEMLATTAEIALVNGELLRRQDSNKMERDVTAKTILTIDASISAINNQIMDEESTLETFKEKSRRSLQIAEAQARRATNSDFNNWYVGKLKSLHGSAFDIAVRYCKMAELQYHEDLGDGNSRFIYPMWDGSRYGLLSGQSLLQDLQRMELSYMERFKDPGSGRMLISLEKISPSSITALKQTGRAIFSISESVFDEDRPGEHERRICSIKIRFVGPGRHKDMNARLTMIGHFKKLGRGAKQRESKINVLGSQKIELHGVETDTEDGNRVKSRAPFERCGVESTWMLSFPAAVSSIRSKKVTIMQKRVLDSIRDVQMTVRYSFRL